MGSSSSWILETGNEGDESVGVVGPQIVPISMGSLSET